MRARLPRGLDNWSQNTAADHRTQPGRPLNEWRFMCCPESWATYPTTCSLTAASLAPKEQPLNVTMWQATAFMNTPTVCPAWRAVTQHHAHIALQGWRSQPATAACRWTLAASPGSQEATSKAMPDHNRLGPGNHKLSSNNEVTNMCTETVHVPDAVCAGIAAAPRGRRR